MKNYRPEAEAVKAKMLPPISAIHRRTYRRINSFVVYTIYDLRRLEECVRIYNQSVVIYLESEGERENDGLFGVVVEITSHRPTSTLIHLREQTRVDSYVVINDRPRKLEVKTNGGEMQDFYKLKASERRATYLHFVLDIEVRPSKYNPEGIRQIEFLSTLNHFLQRCEEANAIKSNGSNIRGAKCNLRADNKRMFEAFVRDLEEGLVIPFDRRMVYTAEDFEI